MNLDIKHICFRFLIALFIAIMIASTSYDLVVNRKAEKKENSELLYFYKNLKMQWRLSGLYVTHFALRILLYIPVIRFLFADFTILKHVFCKTNECLYIHTQLLWNGDAEQKRLGNHLPSHWNLLVCTFNYQLDRIYNAPSWHFLLQSTDFEPCNTSRLLVNFYQYLQLFSPFCFSVASAPLTILPRACKNKNSV